MTQTKHTPGPWRVFSALGKPEIVTDRKTAHETESICMAGSFENAFLIAAAPELLELLTLALRALNTTPRFRVHETDSYAIAALIDATLKHHN